MSDNLSLIPVFAAYGLAPDSVERVPTGLIHDTYFVSQRGTRFVLQSVSPIFSPLVHEDIHAVTSHLAQKGLLTPRLLPTLDGALWLEQSGKVYRLMEFISGKSHDHAESPAVAREAGRALGRFHAALADLSWAFRARRSGVHDTARHLRTLEDALREHPGHALFPEVERAARLLFAETAGLDLSRNPPERVVHGDPKLNNLLFDDAGEALAWVDLDTVGPMPLPLELGDAFRSWCNPAGESAAAPVFDRLLFSAALDGYAESGGAALSRAEIEALAASTGRIMLELSARFLADALYERYFGWDPRRFASRGVHNLERGRNQLNLALDFAAQRREVDALVARAFPA